MGVFNYAGSSAFLIRAEYNLSQAMGYFINTPLVGLKAYGVASFQKYDDEDNPIVGREKYTFTYLRGGLSKEIYFARRFHIGVLAGGGLEQAAWEDTDDSEDVDNSGKYSTFAYSYGAKIGVNLFGNMELVATAMQHTMVSDVLEYDFEGNLSTTHTGTNWNDVGLFPDRHGLGIDISLRILFCNSLIA